MSDSNKQIDLSRIRKTYSAFRQPPVLFSGGGGGGGGGGTTCCVFTENPSGTEAKTTSSVSFDGTFRYPSQIGSDVFFFVSGSISGSGADDNKTVFGGDVVISGALEQGLFVSANGKYSHAEGTYTIALGLNSHAEGQYSLASGNASHAEGFYSTASAFASHAEGEKTHAQGTRSHAEGSGSLASGGYSHAEGFFVTASGLGSHAEGQFSVAYGEGSHASGYYVIASGSNIGQNVVGKYNKRDNNFSLFVIGDGSGDSDANRSDILRVNSGSTPGAGRVEVTGSLVATLGLSGSLTTLSNGTPYIRAGANITITTGSGGWIEITSSAGGGGGGSNQWNELSPSPRLNTTASISLAGGLGSSLSAQDKGAFFFVSGGISNTAGQTDLSLFGGDVTTSGSVTLKNTQASVSSYTRFVSLSGQTTNGTESNLASTTGVEGIDVSATDSINAFLAEVVSIESTTNNAFTVTTKCVVKVASGTPSIFYKNVLDYSSEMNASTNVDWLLSGNTLHLRAYNSGSSPMKTVATVTHSRLL